LIEGKADMSGRSGSIGPLSRHALSINHGEFFTRATRDPARVALI